MRGIDVTQTPSWSDRKTRSNGFLADFNGASNLGNESDLVYLDIPRPEQRGCADTFRIARIRMCAVHPKNLRQRFLQHLSDPRLI